MQEEGFSHIIFLTCECVLYPDQIQERMSSPFSIRHISILDGWVCRTTISCHLYFIPLLNPKRDLRGQTQTLLETQVKRIPSWRTHDNLQVAHLSVWCPFRLDIRRIYSEILLVADLQEEARSQPHRCATTRREGFLAISRPSGARISVATHSMHRSLALVTSDVGKFSDAVTYSR